MSSKSLDDTRIDFEAHIDDLWPIVHSRHSVEAWNSSTNPNRVGGVIPYWVVAEDLAVAVPSEQL